MKYLAAVLLSGTLALAEGTRIEPIAASPNHIQTRLRSSKTNVKASYIDDKDVIFPHIATGGGWETVMVLVNLSLATADVNLYFNDDNGDPMDVTFRTYPEMELITTSAAHIVMPPGCGFNYSLFDTGGATKTGWIAMEYNSSTITTRVGGYAAFRYKNGSYINEGLVPISSIEDETFFMPFDNYEGFATGVALVNPGMNMTSSVSIGALGTDGSLIAETTIQLAPGQHKSFVLSDLMPETAERVGTLLIEGSTHQTVGSRYPHEHARRNDVYFDTGP